MQRPLTLFSLTFDDLPVEADASPIWQAPALQLLQPKYKRPVSASKAGTLLGDFLLECKTQLGSAALEVLTAKVAEKWKTIDGQDGLEFDACENVTASDLKSCWYSFVEHFTRRGLQRERRDEEARAHAQAGDTAMVAFLDAWNKRVESMQRKQPGKWQIPELAPDEVRDELRQALLLGLLQDGFAEYEKVACEATFKLIVHHRDRLRVRRHITRVYGPILALSRDPMPSPEETMIIKDYAAKARYLLNNTSMSRIQRGWVNSFSEELEHAEMQGKELPSFTDVSRRRGKTRAAASRMASTLQSRLDTPLLKELFEK